MQCWVLTYFEATRYGTLVERERLYGANLEIREVRKIAERFITNQQLRGKAIMSQYDLAQKTANNKRA